MTNQLSNAADWLASQRTSHMGTEVTYRRGGESVVLVATLGQTEFDQDDRSGMIVRGQVRDYLVTAAELILDGETILPARNDRIEETVDGVTHHYEVLPLGAGKQQYRYSDPFRTTLRIHTKYVKSEPAS